jgi:hypothetical protein
MSGECYSRVRALIGFGTAKTTTRQGMIDVFHAFKQGELTNVKAGSLLADMKVDPGLEEIREMFDSEREGAFYARYRWDKAPEDIKDAVDRTLLFLESGCSLPPRPPATARQQMVGVAVIAIVALLLGAVVMNLVSKWQISGVGAVDILLGLFETLCVMLFIIVTLWHFGAYLIRKIKGTPLPIREYWPFENEAHHEACAREHRSPG